MSSAQDLSWDDAATLLDLQGALLCMRSQGGLLNPENEECVVFYLLPGQGPASSHHPALIEFLLLRNFCPQGRNCSAQGPSISCLSLSLIQMTSPYYCTYSFPMTSRLQNFLTHVITITHEFGGTWWPVGISHVDGTVDDHPWLFGHTAVGWDGHRGGIYAPCRTARCPVT